MLFAATVIVFAVGISASNSQSLQFSPSLTQTSVQETFVAGGFPRPAEGFVTVRCIDLIGVPTSDDVTYSIVDNDPGPFLLNATTGRLSVTADLDYETMTSYSFAVACVNISDPNITGMGMVQIEILPVNEFEPEIMPRSLRLIILSENTPVGTTIASTEPGGMRQYSVTDGDDGPDGNVTFTLSQVSPDNTENARFFDLNFFTGALVLRQRLDVDNVPNAFDQINLRIVACDVYPPRQQCPNLQVNMLVFSSNDNSPQFSSDTYEVSYPESIPVGTPIITAVCTDNDRGAGQFAGIEIYQPTSELWRLPNTTNGTVVLNMSLDYETTQMHEFTLRCYDTGGREDFATVTINVLPVNDVKPVFSQPNASNSQSLQFSPSLTQTSVPETFVAGEFPRPAEGFVVVRCIDSIGVPTSGAVTYSIVDNDPGPFILNATTGRLSVTADLDYETMTSYSFAVACVNISDPNITGMGMVRIEILPVNEFEPEIMPRSLRLIILSENTPVGTTIASTEPGGMRRYSVTDRDDGPDGNVTFTLSQVSQDNTENARFFDLNFFTGALVLRQRLNVDNIPNAFDQINLRIVACDVYPPRQQCPNLQVNMLVFSSNDNSPQFSSDTYEVSYPESIPVGTPIITAVCTDNDRGAGQFAGIEIYQPTSELWQLPNTTNGTVVLNMSLDYETAQMHEFILRCFDTGGREGFATVTVNVLPVNDAKPVFSQLSYAFTVSRINTPSNDLAIGNVTAIDRDLGGRITYSLEDNENFRITNDGRILLVDYILVLEGNSFNLTVTAHDGEFNATSLVYITVTGLLSIPEIVLVGLAGLILLVLVMIIGCCVMYCCFEQKSSKNTALYEEIDPPLAHPPLAPPPLVPPLPALPQTESSFRASVTVPNSEYAEVSQRGLAGQEYEIPTTQCTAYVSSSKQEEPSGQIPTTQCPAYISTSEQQEPSGQIPTTQCPAYVSTSEQEEPSGQIPTTQCPAYISTSEQEEPSGQIPTTQCPAYVSTSEQEDQSKNQKVGEMTSGEREGNALLLKERKYGEK